MPRVLDELVHGAAAAPKQEDVQSAGVQLKRSLAGLDVGAQVAALQPVQQKGDGAGGGAAAVHQAAARGVAGGGGPLPHQARIQAAFGAHDVSSVEAHVGGEASKATAAMGAEAYATGNHVVFGAAPDLHTAAHEAAHVVQQRSGVSLAGGVGKSGDAYEQHADRVADAVVAGRSAEGLLGAAGSAAGGAMGPVQRLSNVKFNQWRNRVGGQKVSEAKQKLPQKLGTEADRILEEMASSNQQDTPEETLTELLIQRLEALINQTSVQGGEPTITPKGRRRSSSTPKEVPKVIAKEEVPKVVPKREPQVTSKPTPTPKETPPKDTAPKETTPKETTPTPSSQKPEPRKIVQRPPVKPSNEKKPSVEQGGKETSGTTEKPKGTGQPLSGIRYVRWKNDVGKAKVEQVTKTHPKLARDAEKILENLVSALQPTSTAEDMEKLLDERLKALVLENTVQRVGGVEGPAKLPKTQQQGDEVTKRFEKMDGKGGLLMRAVASHSELDTFLNSIPSENATQEELKQRQFYLEKYSYIRQDASMRCFGGRNMGFLLDPSKMVDNVLTNEDSSMLMAPGDVMSGNQKPITTKDRGIKEIDVEKGFHGVVTDQNSLKQKGEALGNWNELQMLTAKPNAYMGLFYAWPTPTDYGKVFTEGRKQELAKKWFEKTGQKTLNIYLYKHRGNPGAKDDPKEFEQAKAALGQAKASEMMLIETVTYQGDSGGGNKK